MFCDNQHIGHVARAIQTGPRTYVVRVERWGEQHGPAIHCRSRKAAVDTMTAINEAHESGQRYGMMRMAEHLGHTEEEVS